MTTHVALLRGVNLGPTRRVPMAELRRELEAAGLAAVRTLLASGNVLVDADGDPGAVGERVHAVIEQRFGLDVGVVVRSGAELAGVVERNPLAGVATEDKRLQVVFFDREPPAEGAAEAQAAVAGDEQVVFSGREAYAWHPDGIRRSKLARLLAGEQLGLGTARNWNTVCKLAELASS